MSQSRSVRRSCARCSHRSRHPFASRRELFFESLEDRRLLAAVPVETPLDHAAWQTVDGAGTSGLVHVAVTLTEATNSTVEQKLKAYQQHLAAGKSTQVFEITPLKLRLVNFTTFARSLHYGTFVGQYDTVIVGTSKSQTLTGTSARNLMVGMGGNDVFKGLDGNDIMIGASGNDYFQGGNGDDVCLLMARATESTSLTAVPERTALLRRAPGRSSGSTATPTPSTFSRGQATRSFATATAAGHWISPRRN